MLTTCIEKKMFQKEYVNLPSVSLENTTDYSENPIEATNGSF